MKTISSRRINRGVVTLAAIALGAGTLSGCSLSGDDDQSAPINHDQSQSQSQDTENQNKATDKESMSDKDKDKADKDKADKDASTITLDDKAVDQLNAAGVRDGDTVYQDENTRVIRRGNTLQAQSNRPGDQSPANNGGSNIAGGNTVVAPNRVQDQGGVANPDGSSVVAAGATQDKDTPAPTDGNTGTDLPANPNPGGGTVTEPVSGGGASGGATTGGNTTPKPTPQPGGQPSTEPENPNPGGGTTQPTNPTKPTKPTEPAQPGGTTPANPGTETPATPTNPESPEPTKVTYETYKNTANKFADTLRAKVFELVNRERVKRGLKPTRALVELTKQAQEWSDFSARNNVYAHSKAYQGTESDRPDVQNYSFFGEVVGMVNNSEFAAKDYTADKVAENIVNKWMESPHHKDIIMNKYSDAIGVGIAGNVHKNNDDPYLLFVAQTDDVETRDNFRNDSTLTEYTNPNVQTVPADPTGKFVDVKPSATTPEGKAEPVPTPTAPETDPDEQPAVPADGTQPEDGEHAAVPTDGDDATDPAPATPAEDNGKANEEQPAGEKETPAESNDGNDGSAPAEPAPAPAPQPAPEPKPEAPKSEAPEAPVAPVDQPEKDKGAENVAASHASESVELQDGE